MESNQQKWWKATSNGHMSWVCLECVHLPEWDVILQPDITFLFRRRRRQQKSRGGEGNKILPVNQTCFDGSALKCTQMLCVQYSLILSILGILYFLVVGWLEFPRNKAPFSLGMLITRIPSMSHYKDTRYLSLRDTIIICMHYQCAQRMGQKQKSQDIDMNWL